MSLAQITKETRISLKIGGIIFAVFIVLFLGIKGGSILYSTLFPKPPAPPQEKFGKLAEISFPQSNNTIPQLKVNTVSGALPVFATTINVYKLKEYTPTITALQSARIKAGSLGYTQNQQAVTTSEYKWSKQDSNNTLLYNIISLNFSVESDFATNPSLTIGNLSNKEDVINTAASFIDALGADKADIDITKSIVNYSSINESQLSPTTDPSSASVATVYFLQNPVNNLPIHYPTTDPSILWITLSKPDTTAVVRASFHHSEPDLLQFSTYPLKTANEALDDLKNGKGYVVKPTTASEVDITDVSLGYYLNNDDTQKYLMPIVVFTGSGGFQAYVSAVR